ncbi:MAG: hypothetical protein R3E98_11350 [Gemmatimonadota bacterium]
MQRRIGCASGVALAAGALLVGQAGPAVAQAPDGEPDAYAHAGALALNAVVGGVISGVSRELRGGSFREAFTLGALGGGLSYGGKWVATRRFDGAGLSGRQIAAVGHSFTRNAGAGESAFARLTFPLWFARLEWDRTRGRLRPGVQWSEVAALTWAVASDDLELDAGTSLSTGAMVFDAPRRRVIRNGRDVNGFELEGVTVIAGIRASPYEDVLAHEVAHVLQGDLLQSAIGDPLETWLLEQVGAEGLRRLGPLGLIANTGWSTLNAVLWDAPGSGPFEKEARLLAGRR